MTNKTFIHNFSLICRKDYSISFFNRPKIINIYRSEERQMRNKNVEILNSLYEDAAAGADAVKTLLPMAESAPLKGELIDRLSEYGEITSSIIQTMGYYGKKPRQTNVVQKVNGWNQTRLWSNDTDDVGIAETVINGTTLSIAGRSGRLDGSSGTDPAVRRLCDALTRIDNDGIRRMRGFLS